MSDTLDRILTSVLPTLVTAAGGLVAAVQTYGKRLDALEKRIAALDALERRTLALEVAPPPASLATQRPVAPRTTRGGGGGITRDEVRGIVAEAVRHALDLAEIRRTKEVADAALSRAQFTEYVDGDADRWERVTRALGVLEGSLEVVRDQLRTR